MLIAIEGCDGTGKTTLAKTLATLLNAEIIHCTTRTANDEDFFRHIIRLAEGRNIIADRWCYGQFVYQKSEERPLKQVDRSAEEVLKDLEMMMLNHEVKLILATAPEQVIKQRLEARGEHLINGLTISEIQERFKSLKEHSLLTWIEYNTGGDINV